LTVPDFDSLREEIRRERERLDQFERRIDGIEKVNDKVLKVMQGDSAWKEKGVIDQLAEVATFMMEMKGFNFKEMKDFATDYNEFKKRGLWLCGGIATLMGFVTIVLNNIDKIQNLFHH
jgi:hypothetical protein